MSLTFTNYERAESSLTDLGTITSIVGQAGFLGIIPKNFKDLSKRVVIVLTKKDGTSATVSCSKAVSAGLRDKSITLGNLMSFNLLENEDGVAFISMPAVGTQLQQYAVASLKLTEYVPQAINYEELASL